MPLRGTEARRLIRRLLAEGVLRFGKHARIEMRKDGLDDVDAVNVMRGGVVDEPEFENGGWRYRIRTQRMFFVVELEPDQERMPADDEDVSGITIAVVTASKAGLR